jgi:hypothetical protein
MHIKIICKVPRIGGYNLIFGENRKWKARLGDWCKTNKITWVKLEWPPKSMVIIIWPYILCFHMHCSNKTCVGNGKRSKANGSHNYFFNSKKGVLRAFLYKLFGGKSNMYVVFLKKSLGERNNKNSLILFHVFILTFETSPLFGWL